MADEKKNPLGPTGRQLVKNVKRLREERQLTYRELSEKLEAAGRPIPPLGLSRIEKGTRRVDADDLVALAYALGVNPSALLFPPTDHHGELYAVTGAGSFRAHQIWNWADGKMPLVGPSWNEAEEVYFQLRARPKGRRDINEELLKALRVLGKITDDEEGVGEGGDGS